MLVKFTMDHAGHKKGDEIEVDDKAGNRLISSACVTVVRWGEPKEEKPAPTKPKK